MAPNMVSAHTTRAGHAPRVACLAAVRRGLGWTQARGRSCARAMRNVDWIVIAPTVAYVLLVAFALWVGLGH
jgi:hypothetical protein